MGEGSRRSPAAIGAAALFGLGLLLVLSRAFLFDLRTLATSSMAPNLAQGDLLLVWRLGRPEPGDIVLLRLDGDAERYLKRVVAVEGERVELTDGALRVDGVEAVEGAAEEERVCGPGGARQSTVVTEARGSHRWKAVPGGRDVFAETVPAGHVYVLGDHRPRSKDSRTWGPIPVDDIVGVVVHRWPRGAPCDGPSE
ncbi:MAG: signal peptidase I [Alphaproteobacteria bacterium]|nr:signal peptidase I [Alphaproteobacteria bacterium]